MKHYFTALLAAVTLVSCNQDEINPSIPEAADKQVIESPEAYVPGKANVYLSEELTAMLEESAETGTLVTKSQGLNNALEELGIAKMTRLFPHAGEFEPRTRAEGLHRWYVVEYSEQTPVTKAQDYMVTIPGFEIVEPVMQIKTDEFNDLTSNYNLWGLYNQSYKGFDINVRKVWEEYTVGNPNVIVAVVDNGIELRHEDLADNCLSSGHFNFVSNNSSIIGGDHGTHVAGTIAAVGNNGKGIVGIAGGDKTNGRSGVKLLSCQIFMDTTNGTEGGSSSAAIKWGADHGAVISQNSWGYNYDSDGDGQIVGEELTRALAAKTQKSDRDAIDYFIKYAGCDNNGNQLPGSPMKGGVVIFAAGNDAITNSAPAEYDQVIAVGSVTKDGNRSSFSNYGDFVDICAPGSDIVSTIPNNGYATMNGTSMACPHVSGVAALLVSHFGGQGFTNEMLKEKLLSSANKTIISQAYQIGGLLDAYGAFAYGNDKAPAAVTDLEVKGRGNNLDLTWTIPSDEDGKPAYGFFVIYDKDRTKVENATPENLNGAQSAAFAPEESKVGEKVTFSINKLEFETEYTVKMTAYSYGRNHSAATGTYTAATTGNNAPEIEVEGEDNGFRLTASETLNITIVVTEPDSHEFEVEHIKGSEAETLTTTLDGNWKLSIKGNAANAGTYISKIVATDEYGLKTTKNVEYTILENSVPVKLADPENVFMKSKGQEYTIDMGEYISDPDGEQLKFEAELSNSKIAHVNIKGNSIIITSLTYGSTDIKIIGKDARGETAEVIFKLLVKDPSDPISVYPNPVIDFVNVSTLDEADTKITITSQTGKKVYDQMVKASAFEPARIDMSSYAPGVYSMTVVLDGKTYKELVTKI